MQKLIENLISQYFRHPGMRFHCLSCQCGISNFLETTYGQAMMHCIYCKSGTRKESMMISAEGTLHRSDTMSTYKPVDDVKSAC
jgi:hypothetical protein